MLFIDAYKVLGYELLLTVAIDVSNAQTIRMIKEGGIFKKV